MPLSVIRYVENNTAQWGVTFGQRIAPLHVQAATTGELVSRHWDQMWSTRAEQATLRRESVKLLSPVTTNQQFLCLGVNYRSHVEESGLNVADFPFITVFTKASSCITASDSPVMRPPHVHLLDYELELGLILRRDLSPGAKVQPESIGDWLAGVTIVNDLSARDIQLPQGQFYKGKSYRGFGPVGPALVLLRGDEWSRWPELHMRLDVNGQPRQDAYCAELIHGPAATLTELATVHDVSAGDLIATGTPAGCAARAPSKAAMFISKHFLNDTTKWRMFVERGRKDPAYLRPGDRISATIRTDDGTIDLGEQVTTISAS